MLSLFGYHRCVTLYGNTPLDASDGASTVGFPLPRSDRGDAKLRGLLAAGDPRGEVRLAWHAKETLRGLYEIGRFGSRRGVTLASSARLDWPT